MSNQSQGGHHLTEDSGGGVATPADLAQINVNTIAINNNANSITSANTNIATNASNITLANSAIVSNDNDITTLSTTIGTANTNIATNTTNIGTINSSITTLNTTTATNTTNIATNLGTNNAQQSAINMNTTGRITNATNIATNTTNITNNNNNVATNLATNNTQNTNIATNATNIASNTSDILTIATATTNNTGNITTNTNNIATNTSAIATATTELANVVLGADKITNSKILLGNGTNFANGAGLQNASLNSGVLHNDYVGFLQNNNGDTFVSAVDGRFIKFRINAQTQIEINRGLIDCRDIEDGNMTMMVRSEAPYISRLSVGGCDTDGDGNAQGTGIIAVGQGINADGSITFGGGLVYNGDDNPNINEPQDHTTLMSVSNGVRENVMSWRYNDQWIRHYRTFWNVNYKEEYYGDFASPRLIGMTAVSASTLQAHRFCYNGATATDNTWYMPHPDFKCVCRTPPSVDGAEYVVSFTTDGYFSTRQVYVCLSSSNSASDIIPSTITFIHSRNSEWTSRIHRVSMFDTTLTADAINVRYIFVKEVQVNSSGNVISSGGNQGFIIFGGRDAHNGTTTTQTTHYWDNDLTPTTPTDNAQALLVKCWSIPNNVATTANATSPFQLIGF